MFSILNRLVYKNEIIGLRILIEQSMESDKEEVLDIDMDLVLRYEIDYEAELVEQLEITEAKGVLATREEHETGNYVLNAEDFYSDCKNFVKDIYMNINTGAVSMGIRFSELSDCDFCPFEGNKDICSGNENGIPPCERYEEMSFREYENFLIRAERRYFKCEGELARREKEKLDKEKARKLKAKSTRLRNSALNKQISTLRKQKKAYEDYINMRKSISLTNAMIGKESRDEITGLTIFEEKLRGIEENIDALVKERKRRNREYKV